MRNAALNKIVRTLVFSALAGLLAGTAAAVFLIFLAWATDTRDAHREIIWLLPLAGLFIGWAYHHYAGAAGRGNNLILDEIHNPQRTLPRRMSPFVLFGTVLTHLFGGSAGREGTAVQMGASLADQLARYFKGDPDERKMLLVAGAGAGFGAAIGAPLAGVIFGMEVIAVRRLRVYAPLPCLIASFVAFYTTHALGAPHTHYPPVLIPDFSVATAGWAIVAGIAFGLASRLFVYVTHLIERWQRHYVAYPPLRPFVAGLLLVVLYRWEGSYAYAGLGIPTIQRALLEPSSLAVPVWKLGFTALTIGSGFKGGEFIPMVFIGTTLGSALSTLLPAGAGWLGALGFAAVFGAGANTPIACTLMAAEIFGARLTPFALLACFAAYYVSGHPGIYHAQPLHRRKLAWLGELPKRFLR